MFNVGDRVKLIKKSSGYDPGAEGIVKVVPEQTVVKVHIDKDEEGNTVTPPDPLPPLPASHFSRV